MFSPCHVLNDVTAKLILIISIKRLKKCITGHGSSMGSREDGGYRHQHDARCNSKDALLATLHFVASVFFVT